MRTISRVLGTSENASYWGAQSFNLRRRLVGAVLVFSLELVFFSVWLDTATLRRHSGLTGLVADWGSLAVRVLVAASAIVAILVSLHSKSLLQRTAIELREIPIAWFPLIGHIFAVIVFGALSSVLFTTTATGKQIDFLTVLWLFTGVLLAGFGTLVFLPPPLCFDWIRRARRIWVAPAIAGLVACVFGTLAQLLWKPTTSITFRLVTLTLRPFFHDLVSDPRTRILGTRGFRIEINPQCAGLEGVGLMLVFGVFCLWLFHDELKIFRACLLVPAGMIIAWLLNIVRIALLIVIGSAGARSLALGGFHSQAGWIAFNVVAVGLSLSLRRIQWVQAKPEEKSARNQAENPATPYLLPLLAILAAGMISGAATVGVEWLYPLRFLAAAVVLWVYRSEYAGMDWKVGPFSPLAGILAFIVWMILNHPAGVHADNGIAAQLRMAPVSGAAAWMAVRILAAVITVPIAEELAFRGFLTRRLLSPDFLSLSSRSFTWFSLMLSSAAFGLLHGERWLAASVAGALYGLAFLRRGRIGDAVVAHATTNGILAVFVLFRGDWTLW